MQKRRKNKVGKAMNSNLYPALPTSRGGYMLSCAATFVPVKARHRLWADIRAGAQAFSWIVASGVLCKYLMLLNRDDAAASQRIEA